jgi:hypothetical protein
MNNSDYPNVGEDLVDFLSHPQHWSGTEVFLRLKETDQLSVLHYSPLINKFLWRQVLESFSMTKTRVGSSELCADLVKEGWVLQ